MEYRLGVWNKIPEAQALTYAECRKRRSLDINLEYYCSVTEKSLCPYADRMRNVKIEYFCWELGECFRNLVKQEILKNLQVADSLSPPSLFLRKTKTLVVLCFR